MWRPLHTLVLPHVCKLPGASWNVWARNNGNWPFFSQPPTYSENGCRISALICHGVTKLGSHSLVVTGLKYIARAVEVMECPDLKSHPICIGLLLTSHLMSRVSSLKLLGCTEDWILIDGDCAGSNVLPNVWNLCIEDFMHMIWLSGYPVDGGIGGSYRKPWTHGSLHAFKSGVLF